MSDQQGTDPVDNAPAADDMGTPAPAATVTAQDGGDDTSTLSHEDARKLRSEAKNLRDRLKELEAEKKQRDDADLSATQKLEREKTALEARIGQLESSLRDSRVQTLASKVGVKSGLVDMISPLIDWDAVDADDPKAIERAIKEIVKERPDLSARQGGLEGGNGRGAGGKGDGDMDSIIRRAGGRA